MKENIGINDTAVTVHKQQKVLSTIALAVYEFLNFSISAVLWSSNIWHFYSMGQKCQIILCY